MILLALLVLFFPMLLMLQQSAHQYRQQTEEPPPVIEHVAFLRRAFVDPTSPDIVLASALIPTHSRITSRNKTWEIGGEGKPVASILLRFAEPLRLQSGALAWSTEDLLAKDGEEQYGRDRHD